MAWKPSKSAAKYGVAVANFDGHKVRDGLSFQVGDTVQILEEYKEWFRGFLTKNKNIKGIFPKSFLCLQEATVENPGFYEVVHPQVEPVVQEVTTVLREWGIIWKKLYLEQKFQMFLGIKKIMSELIEHRRQIMSKTLTQDQQREVKHLITHRIDWGNSKLGLDLVPRIDGEIVDTENLSIVELYKVHVASMESSDSVAKNDAAKSTLTSLSKGSQRHLLMSVKSFLLNIGEESVVFFSLYDIKASQYISERYMVKVSKLGTPREIEKMDRMTAIFTELTSNDWLRELYLVCHVYREGKLVIDSKKNPSTAFRRPFGIGVIFVADIVREKIIDEDEQEFHFTIYSCSDSEFHSLEEYIIKKQTAKYSSGSNINEISIGLKVVHGDLDKIMEDNPLLKNADVAVTRKLGFPEVIMPGDIRNDFYVTIAHADFEKGGKTAQKNIEVLMCVVSNTGKVLQNCISLGTGEKQITEYHSYVLYHNNAPRWNERIKVQIPLSEFHNAHLRFTFSHCTRHESRSKGERFYAFSFIKLVNADGTVVKDDSYELLLYKNDSSVSFLNVQSYLNLASHQVEMTARKNSGTLVTGTARSAKETLTINTELCSTKLTQNSELVGLLKWRLKQDSVLDVLTSVLKVEAEELVKFLQDVFDALFNILSDRGNECAMAVFNVLVHVICFIETEKYHRFKSTINTYIEEHFSGALAYKSLIACLKKVLQQKPTTKTTESLANALKSFPVILRIIIQSRFLHSRASATLNLEEFQESLKDLFAAVCKMMKTKTDHNEPKINALEQFPSMVEELSKVFSYEELSVIVSDVIMCIPKVVGSSSSSVRIAKLNCIHNIACSKFFKDQDARAAFLPTLIEHLQYYMNTKQELTLCLEILGDVITALQNVESAYVKDDISLVAQSLLFILLNIYLTIDRKGSLTGLTVSCLVGLLRLMEDHHYCVLLQSYDDKRNLKDFLMKFIVACNNLLSQEVFPSDWFVLRILSNNLILMAIQYLSKAFIDEFLIGNEFNYQLWNNYFQLAVAFVVQPCLQLESFMENKRDRIIDRYGDMRQIMGMEIVEMWGHLGPQKINFIPGLIGPFLEVTLIPETELRRSTIPIFYDMMQVEFAEQKNFTQVEAELFDKIDILVSNGKGDQAYEELFRKIIMKKLENCGDPSFHDKALNCVRSISQLLKRLLDYRAVIANNDCGMDEQMTCTVRLLEFYQSLGRNDMYIRYIHKLCDMHSACENYIEAGCTLLSHARLLTWREELLKEELNFPEQPEWERKEQLYLKIIDYFDKGKTWENGLKLCKELALIYEKELVDFSKLSNILRTQAQFYDNIMRELRPEPEYFRVSFYGQGFPHYYKVLTTNKPLDESYLQSSGQYIQCCSVQPVAEVAPHIKMKKVSEKIASYYKVNEVRVFTFSRPFHKGPKNEDNEFKTLWLERTTMKTDKKFPNILRWSMVYESEREELDPLANAVETISSKNKELAEIVTKFEGYSESNINPLSMVLNGVIDANVNGGISKYQTAFLNEEYLFLHPEKEDEVESLKTHLRNQVDELEAGLALHERLSTASLKPFHDKMVTMFARMKESIETGIPIEELMIIDSYSTGSPTLDRNQSPKLLHRISNISTGSADQQDPPKKESHLSMPLMPRGFSRIGKKLSESFAAVSTPMLQTTDSGNSNNKSSKTLERRFTSSKSSSSLVDQSAGAPPVVPRRTSVPSLLQRGSASCSVKTKQEYKASKNTLSPMRNQPITGSAPALDNISEDDQVPPKLPMKRKSIISTKSIMAIYDEKMEDIFNPEKAVEINIEDDEKESEEQPTYDGLDTCKKNRKERPRSMPIDADGSNYDAVASMVQSQSTASSAAPPQFNNNATPPDNDTAQAQKRPVPKPRPKTLFMRAGSVNQLHKMRTISAEDLLKSNPAIDRVVRTGIENGAPPPPVPLKRAQLYRSQERIGNNGYSSESSTAKESKF
eukprot:gene7122-7926_t